jgi:protein-tyrosine phosphatase
MHAVHAIVKRSPFYQQVYMSGPKEKIIHVLFVCLGNICRSPMAEAVFRHLVAQAGLSDHIHADSAGIGAYHVGEPPHHGTRRVLRERGISYTHSARLVTPNDLRHFDYIIALDSENLADLDAMARATNVQPRLLLEYAPAAELHNVPDPYYSGRFDEVYDLVEQGCRGLLERIVAEKELIVKYKT